VERLKRLILGGEDDIVRRVVELARTHAYAQLMPALEDDYRVTVATMSANLAQSLNIAGDVPELRATDDLTADPIASLGARMARASRGDSPDVRLTLGLLKRYRQAYLDLIRQSGLPPEEVWLYSGVTERFFDRFELGYVGHWCGDVLGTVPKAIIDRSRELAAEKNRYLATFADLPVPVLLLDAEGRVENINAAAALLFSPPESRRSRYHRDPARRDRSPVLAEEIEAFRAGQERQNSFERELKTGKGTRYFQIRFSKMHGADGSEEGMLVILNDLTYRRHAEDALRRSQVKYASLFENMLSGFAYTQVVLDRRNRPVDYTFLEVNEAFERLTGLDSRQIIGRRLTEVLPGGDSLATDWIGILGRVALTGETATFEAYFDRITRWYAASVYSPAPGYVTLMLTDISELKFIEESLLASRELYLMAEWLPALVWRAGADGRVDYVNRAWLEFTGRFAHDAIGEAWLEDVHPDDREARRLAVRHAAVERIPFRIEYRLRRYDGIYRRVLDTGRFFEGMDGESGAALGCAMDVGPDGAGQSGRDGVSGA
jgi:PAS domain S-box-containing protein